MARASSGSSPRRCDRAPSRSSCRPCARREDIPALAAHFAARAGIRLGGAPLAFAPRNLEALVGYCWPGNVRELAAVVERAAIPGGGRRLRLDFALDVMRMERRARSTRNAGRRATDAILPLDDAARLHIEATLEATAGRMEGRDGAARWLDINPHTLRARMRKLGIDWSQYRVASQFATPDASSGRGRRTCSLGRRQPTARGRRHTRSLEDVHGSGRIQTR